jgi:hypothetical protein
MKLEAATHRMMMNNDVARSDTQRTDRDLDRIHRLQDWRALINVSHRCGLSRRHDAVWLGFRTAAGSGQTVGREVEGG